MLNRYRALTVIALAIPLIHLHPSLATTNDPSFNQLTLTHPDATWSLLLNLPGFGIDSPKVYRDYSQVWVKANNPDSEILLTVFIEKLMKADDAHACRKYYVKKLKRVLPKPDISERGEAALAEFPLGQTADEMAQQKHFHAFYFKEGFCIDLHLSKTPFQNEDRRDFLAVLGSLTFATASDEDRDRAKTYTLSSGPGEELLLQASQLLRSREFTSADALLFPLCPWERGEISKRDRLELPECTLRTAGISEARDLRTGDKLALLYWRSADRAQKSGMLSAAREIYLKSLDLAPNDAETWYSLGHLYRESEDFAAATDAFDRALDLKPGDPNTMYWIATNLMDLGLLAEAETMLEKVLEADSEDARVWYRRGQVHMKRGDYMEAIDDFEKAKALGVDAKKSREQIRECQKALSGQ